MTRMAGCVLVPLVLAGFLGTSGCLPGQSAIREASSSTGTERPVAPEVAAKPGSVDLAEIDKLMVQVNAHHRHAFKKPYRDKQDRALRMLAQKTRIMVAAWEPAATESALTGSSGAAGSSRAAQADLHTSLEALQKAAESRDVSAVRTHYARVRNNHLKLAATPAS